MWNAIHTRPNGLLLVGRPKQRWQGEKAELCEDCLEDGESFCRGYPGMQVVYAAETAGRRGGVSAA
jgi:hypothetical protein